MALTLSPISYPRFKIRIIKRSLIASKSPFIFIIQASAAPKDAAYSGLLECPCTDRIVKKIEHVYSTQTSGACDKAITSDSLCFEAAASVAGGEVSQNLTTSSETSAPGCSVIHWTNGTITAIYNKEADSQVGKTKNK